VLSTGYTGEMLLDGKMRHAEDIAISKALASGVDLSSDGVTLYSTLEPCSIRASGKTSCCKIIIDNKISTVVYGAKEPYDERLGIVCEGHATLQAAGIKVIFLESMAEQCLQSVVSRRKHL
jgi:pyrimidine deaminase RibD-like protein